MNTVFVLHAFEKTTNGVDQREMDTAKARYKQLEQRVDAERKRAKTADAPLLPAGTRLIVIDLYGRGYYWSRPAVQKVACASRVH